MEVDDVFQLPMAAVSDSIVTGHIECGTVRPGSAISFTDAEGAVCYEAVVSGVMLQSALLTTTGQTTQSQMEALMLPSVTVGEPVCLLFADPQLVQQVTVRMFAAME